MDERLAGARLAPARPADLTTLRDLLAANGLPGGDLTAEHLRYYWVARNPAGIAGVVGLEPCGSAALLRSLAVRADGRGRGLGSRLAAHAESHAVALGIESLYLLTTTAERFFAARDYVAIPRDSAPPAIRATREFSDLCPATSVCMRKRVRG
jgi:amino-acid N-acetyltransferase